MTFVAPGAHIHGVTMQLGAIEEVEQPEQVPEPALPALAWLFVAMALLDAWVVIDRAQLHVGLVPGLTVSGDTGAPMALLTGIGSLAVVLWPVAILRRAPSAMRDHPLLLGGAAIVSAWTLALAAFGWWAGSGVDVAQVEVVTSFAPVAAATHLVGRILLVAGLLRLRDRRMSRLALLVTFGAVAIAILPLALIYLRFDLDGANPTAIGLDLLTTGAVGAWLAVSIAGWLDREPPGRFWAPLAVVAVALLAVDVASAFQALTVSPLSGFFIDGIGTQPWVATVAALVTLVVFATALPAERSA